MTGLVRTTGRPVGLVRTAIEVSVVLVGWALGGNLGVGTVLFVLAIGPLVHVFLPLLTVGERPAGPDAAVREAGPGRGALRAEAGGASYRTGAGAAPWS